MKDRVCYADDGRMQSPTHEQRDVFEQLCLLRALYAHRGPLDRACPPTPRQPALDLSDAVDLAYPRPWVKSEVASASR